MQPIEKQTILITGATSGLGRALVERLAQAGATVVAHGRDADRLARIFAEIRDATSREVDTIQADLADLAQGERALLPGQPRGAARSAGRRPRSAFLAPRLV